MKANLTQCVLTPRQWKLYELLKTDTTKWFTPEEIHAQIPEYPWNENAWDKCPTIREDKKAINSSTRIEKIVVMKNRCFKIANEEEYLEERNAHIRRLKNQVQEIKDMDFKYHRDGMGKLLSCDNKPIDEDSKARPFVEAFPNEVEDIING